MPSGDTAVSERRRLALPAGPAPVYRFRRLRSEGIGYSLRDRVAVNRWLLTCSVREQTIEVVDPRGRSLLFHRLGRASGDEAIWDMVSSTLGTHIARLLVEITDPATASWASRSTGRTSAGQRSSLAAVQRVFQVGWRLSGVPQGEDALVSARDLVLAAGVGLRERELRAYRAAPFVNFHALDVITVASWVGAGFDPVAAYLWQPVMADGLLAADAGKFRDAGWTPTHTHRLMEVVEVDTWMRWLALPPEDAVLAAEAGLGADHAVELFQSGLWDREQAMVLRGLLL